jgi:DNA-binding Lrp family transcriptional regulator
MIPLLQAIATSSNTPLTIEQFVALATDLCQWASFSLTPQDVSIITAVNQLPEITVPALSRLLRTSYKKTHARWKRLTRLNILRVTIIPNYRSIGLQPVILELSDLKRGLRSPYLLSKIRLTGDGNQVLYAMVIPAEQLGAFTRWVERNLGVAHYPYLAESRGRTISFTHYQCEKSSWEIDWRKLFMGAHLLHNETGMDGPPDLYEQDCSSLRPYLLDEKDTRLIPALMSDAHSKLEVLASKLSMSLSQVSRRKDKLTSLGILRSEPVIRRVGLVEEIVMKVDEADPRLLGIVRELPQTWTTHLTELKTAKKQILIYATLPAGSFAIIRYYQRRYLRARAQIFLSEAESGGWPLSFRPYDVERGCWIWSDPVLTDERAENVLPFNELHKLGEKTTLREEL